jgi:acetyl-CoA carboxylase biotin carboxylase subunit
LLAKLIVGGTDREEVIRNLALALRSFDVEGVDSTIELHHAIVQHPDFRAGNINTKWLENVLLRELASTPSK